MILLFLKGDLMEQLDLIEEITRNDGSRYYEISNIDQNGIAELAADHGAIKSVRILQHNIPRTKALIEYEKYINDLYNAMGIEEKIFKGYTPSGTRKYVPHNIDNVIKEMKSAGLRAGGRGFRGGAGR